MVDLNARLDELLPKLMELENKTNLAKKIKDFYLDGANEITNDNSQGFVDVNG